MSVRRPVGVVTSRNMNLSPEFRKSTRTKNSGPALLALGYKARYTLQPKASTISHTIKPTFASRERLEAQIRYMYPNSPARQKVALAITRFVKANPAAYKEDVFFGVFGRLKKSVRLVDYSLSKNPSNPSAKKPLSISLISTVYEEIVGPKGFIQRKN